MLTVSSRLPIEGKKICLIGNRGHHNFGDELIVIGLMKLLIPGSQLGLQPSELPAPSFQLFVSGGDLNFLKKLHRYFFSTDELKHINYIQEIPHGIRSGARFLAFSLFSLFAYFRCDTFVIGGGELFTQETPGSYLYWFWSLLPYWLRKLFFWNTKLYVMGGMQEPTKWYNKIILKLIVRNANGCFMRDEESVAVATSYELRATSMFKHIEWFIDTSYFAVKAVSSELLATSSNLKFSDKEHEARSTKHEAKKHIVINTNPLSGKRTKELSDVVRQYHKDGYEVYFLPAFFTSNKAQDDMLCFSALKKEFDYIKMLDWRERDKFQIIFTSAEKIFCSRLHVFLVAAFWGLDVKPFAYQKKINKNKLILEKIGIL